VVTLLKDFYSFKFCYILKTLHLTQQFLEASCYFRMVSLSFSLFSVLSHVFLSKTNRLMTIREHYKLFYFEDKSMVFIFVDIEHVIYVSLVLINI
jgi:hypothetical protein